MSSSSGERLQLWPQVHQLLLLLDYSHQEFSAVAGVKPHFVSCCKCQVAQVLQPVKLCMHSCCNSDSAFSQLLALSTTSSAITETIKLHL